MATHRLLLHLVARGHEVQVFACNARDRPYEVDGLPVETGLRGNCRAVELARGADVVISHFGDDGTGAGIARDAGRPLVRLAHGGGPFGSGPACVLAVFNSFSLREAWAWDGPSIVVHPYTDPAEYRTVPGDRITLVNLSDPKGGRLFDRVTRAMPGHRFLGVKGGYGNQIVPNRSNVAIQAMTSNMRDDVYARTRVLLMPSAYETWGMVGVEAMASGIPVIAHPTPGLVESLGAAGIFVDREDGQGWVDAIRRLDDPVEWAAVSERASKRSAELAAYDDRDLFADTLEALV